MVTRIVTRITRIQRWLATRIVTTSTKVTGTVSKITRIRGHQDGYKDRCYG